MQAVVPGLYEASHEMLLKQEVTQVEKQTGSKRYIRLGNIAPIVGHLLNAGASLDQQYWRKHLLDFATDKNDNGVLQRHALFALGHLGDPSIINQLPASLLEGDELIGRAFLGLCTRLSPDSPQSLQYFIQATVTGTIEARYGLYAIKAKDALIRFLETFNTNESFRRAFLDQGTIFKDQDQVLVEHIRSVWDNDVTRHCEQAIVHSLDYAVAPDGQRSTFIHSLAKVLKDHRQDIFPAIIDAIRASQVKLYYAVPLFAALVENTIDLTQFLTAMIAAREQTTAFNTLLRIKFSGTPQAEQLFEAGRSLLPQQYQDWEQHHKAGQSAAAARQQQLLDDFREYLEPTPKNYNPGVFAFYLQHAEDLTPLLSVDDKARLTTLITDEVLKKINPADYELSITEQHAGGGTTYTISSNIAMFRDALRAAEQLGIDVTRFRQHIINYIPFAYSDGLQTIFRLIKHLTASELASVIAVYQHHQSDLWRHLPSSFVEVVHQYHIADAVPVLRMFVKESTLEAYVRSRALEVAESLHPDKAFLKQVANTTAKSKNPAARELSQAASNLLITNHADPSAIKQRLKLLVAHATPFNPPSGAHLVSPIEEELTGGRSLARPLMELRAPGYEGDYLRLLDHAMELWAKGKDFYANATYLWDIVYAYFDNLKETGSYEPLQALETKISAIKSREGANWLAARMLRLRRSYLAYLGKPKHIAKPIEQYNEARRLSRKEINNSVDLAYHLRDAFETDLTRWIEGEGAYGLFLTEKLYKTGIQQFEKLAQKTLKSQIENILLKRGFQVEILREPQLLDDKRTDLLIRYGFAGPVIVEIKLTSNTDMHTTTPEKSKSYRGMQQYMQGYGATHGIFLIINNKEPKSLPKITEAFGKIPNVWVKVFDCRLKIIKKRAAAPAKKTKSPQAKTGRKARPGKSKK